MTARKTSHIVQHKQVHLYPLEYPDIMVASLNESNLHAREFLHGLERELEPYIGETVLTRKGQIVERLWKKLIMKLKSRDLWIKQLTTLSSENGQTIYAQFVQFIKLDPIQYTQELCVDIPIGRVNHGVLVELFHADPMEFRSDYTVEEIERTGQEIIAAYKHVNQLLFSVRGIYSTIW